MMKTKIEVDVEVWPVPVCIKLAGDDRVIQLNRADPALVDAMIEDLVKRIRAEASKPTARSSH
jgi:hypothetical protein